MKFKKLVSIFLSCALMAGMMAGCAGDTGTSSAPATDGQVSEAATGDDTTAGGNHKIYLITMDQMDQHWVNVDAGCKKAVEELGNVDYTWLAPDVKDDAKQIECINNAVAGGAEAILLAANGPDAVTAALEEADAAGVKIVYVDSGADFPGVQTLATDNAATASTVAREEGFRAAFEGTNFELLETQYGDGDAAKSKDIAANYITQGCVGIFGANEGSTVGTGNAIQEAGQTVIGVGFDKSDTILNLIKNGYILCTMAQNPDVMGYEGIQSAVKALEGEDVGEEFIDTGVSVINKDTL